MDRPEEATRLDGRLLASGATDRICIWDLRSSNCIRVIDAGTSVIAVAFSPDRYFLASVQGNAVKLWEIASGKLHMTLDDHNADVHSVVFSPNGKYLASGSHDFTVKLWEVATGNLLRTFKHGYMVSGVAFSGHGQFLASSCFDGTAKIWDVASGVEIMSFDQHTDDVMCLAFSPDDRQLVTGSYDTTLRIWDVTALRPLKANR
jgi:WD40 repeat protein